MNASLLALTLVCSVFTEPLPVAQVDDPFPHEIATLYGAGQGLPEAPVLAVALLPGGQAIAAAGGKIYEFAEERWTEMENPPGFEVAFLRTQGETTWAAGQHGVAKKENGTWTAYDVPELRSLTCLAPYKEGALVGTDAGLFAVGVDPVMAPTDRIGSVAVRGDKIAIGTVDALLIRDANKPSENLAPIYPYDEKRSWNPRQIRALAWSGDKLWYGDINGAGRFYDDEWSLFTGEEGLPSNRFTCATGGEEGVVWFGTVRGAVRYDGSRWLYRSGKRWLPHDTVTDIAVAPDGTAWIATRDGISRIERKPTTLAERATHFEEVNEKRHVRDGFVVRCYFDEPGNLDSWTIRNTDNDGLYTAMYGAGECFRYGATKDPRAKELANRCFDALRRLEAATTIEGFPARSILRTDIGAEDPNAGWSEQANLNIQKKDPQWKNILPRWPKSADGKYWWKCDTSSDEVCGHYFFYGAYYDLVAESNEEKEAVVELVRKITNHIVDHDFSLTDHDGKPTRWAQWGPDYTNSDHGWADRGLQAIEILGFLNTAIHIAGDQKFRDAAQHLRDKYAYHIMAIRGRSHFPPEYVVPWDSNLAFQSHYLLLKYEEDPELRKMYRDSIDLSWLFVSNQNDPFFTFVTRAVRPEGLPGEGDMYDPKDPRLQDPLARAVQTLRDTPRYLIGWETVNSDRLDVATAFTPGQKPTYGWYRATGHAIPMNERSQIRINSDHFDLDTASGDRSDKDRPLGGGQAEYESTFFLLPYYMALYHGFIK